MCNKGPINTSINPIHSGTQSSNSGTVTANVGNVGTLDNGGNATAYTHVEVHPPSPDLYNMNAEYEILAAKNEKQMVIYIFCGVIFILIVLVIAGIIAWFCSREQERMASNSAYCRNHTNSQNQRQQHSAQRSGRDDESMPLCIYNVPPAYDDIEQKTQIKNDQAVEVTRHNLDSAKNAAIHVAQPAFNPEWRRTSERRSARQTRATVIRSDGKGMI